jgi:hypothetical protein
VEIAAAGTESYPWPRNSVLGHSDHSNSQWKLVLHLDCLQFRNTLSSCYHGLRQGYIVPTQMIAALACVKVCIELC